MAENGDFRQGGYYPWMILALRVIGIRDSSLATQRSSTQQFMNGPSPAGNSVRSPGVHDSKRDQPLLTPRGKIKNGRAHAVSRRRA